MTDSPSISSSDRLSVTLVFAILFLAVLIFGVSFTYQDPTDPDQLQSMEIILVQQRSEEAPEDADYLASVSQQGGGTVSEKARPTSPVSGPVPKLEQGESPVTRPNTTPKPTVQTPTKVMTQAVSVRKEERIKPTTETPELPSPTAEELLQRSREMARLEAEIDKDLKAYASRPRNAYVDASTREYVYAGYLHNWTQKVERHSTLNFPAEISRRRLEGEVTVTAVINRSGHVEKTEIRNPSKHKILNESAIKLIYSAAPYGPFPESFRDKIDQLFITRTWRFLPNNVIEYD